MTTNEVANRFYEMAQQGQYDQIQTELYSADAASIEPEHTPLPTVKGLDKIREKAQQWNAMVEAVHSGYCNQPQVAGDYFVCTMGMDVTMKELGRIKMDEIALYEVKDGKIVREQFFFKPS